MLKTNGWDAMVDALYPHPGMPSDISSNKYYWLGYRHGFRGIKVPRKWHEAYCFGASNARHREHESITHPGANVGVIIHPEMPC